MSEPLLDVRGLRVSFSHGEKAVRVVDDLSYTVDPGRALAIVGESGSGKTVGVRALLGLLPPGGKVDSGQAFFDGADLLSVGPEALRQVRGREVAMVFQSAMQALNPTVTLKRQLTEHLLWHRICGRREAVERAEQALDDVGIPEPRRRLRMYPFQLSGGMRQRAMIAMAMVTRPRLLIADEPTTAVDVTVQRQIIDLLAKLKNDGTAIVLITHDLGVARALCDDVLVMYAGHAVERGPTAAVVSQPLHPYTRGLVGCSIQVGTSGRPLRPIPGSPPDLSQLPAGCPFQPRCPEAASPDCDRHQSLLELAPGRDVACWRADARD
jgi:oligopeptide/dipeptide ABC transporter ATP-binding protein